MIQWHIVDSAEYRAGTKIAGDLYFLRDTKEIYRGEDNFTESVVLYNGTLPTTYALNRLYIDSTTLAGHIHDGTEWKSVIKPVEDTLDPQSGNLVTAKAIAAFVAAEVAKVSTSGDVINALSWDSAEHILTYTKGDSTTTDITFDGLGVSLSYISATGELQLLDASGNKIGDAINLPQEQFVTAGEYDAENKQIILYFDAEKTNSVTIDASALVDIYTGEETDSAAVSVSAGNVITATVKISSESGNTITLKSDGIYVAAPDLSGYMTLVPDATEGHLVTLDANGQVIDSGLSIADVKNNDAKVFQGASLEDAVGEDTPKAGDFAVVSTPIGETGKVQKTAYHYDGINWVAFDSEYDASKIILPEDWLTTTKIGVIQTLTNGQATIARAGTDVLTALRNLTLKESQPTVTQPAVSFSNSSDNEFKGYEVGTVVPVAVTAALSAGSYGYGRFDSNGQFDSSTSAGVSATGWTFTDSKGTEKTGSNSADFGDIEVVDGMEYTVTAKATYDASAYTPATNLKNPATVAGIAAGSKSKTTAKLTGFRKAFWGYSASLLGKDDINSALIRGLQGSSDAAVAVGSSFDVEFVAGSKSVIIAYPATVADMSTVIDTGAMNTPIQKAHDFTVDVEGANSYDAASYKVWVYNFADGASSDNTYEVTI